MADFSRDFSMSYDEDARSCVIRFKCFDTPNSVAVFGDFEDDAAEGALLEARALCLDLHQLWSFNLPKSDISRMNGADTHISVDAHTAGLIQAMIDFHKEEPQFDFTVGSVSFAWKHASRVPAKEELAEALSHVGAGKVHVEGPCEDGLWLIVKDDPATRIDVGGAAKGYAADAVAELLRARGFTSAQVDLGGNLYMLGSHPQGRAWRVSVRVPEGVKAKAPIVQLRDQSAVTSGGYERFVTINGKRYQHIIDPVTGWPSDSDVASATVISASSLEADMLATTAVLTGAQSIPVLAARHPDCRIITLPAACS